ncbi:type II secretion system F family protein [Legionella fairfieldensis]|uniref:type II secretion system F family protein n=1 Tax=Legionella fairfieldensis TaxID=45064 RepID=UPI00048E3DA6|nr:type II secretion system F family protein [Legionella fairfieldensis]
MNKTEKYYYWKGINYNGIKVQGMIEAASSALAKNELGKQGIITQKITTNHALYCLKKNKKITSGHITFFIQQMASLLNAGIPIIQAFDLAINTQSHWLMKQLIISLKKNMENGISFSEAMRKNPSFFNTLLCNLIEAGEKSGKLELMLNKIAHYKEKIETIKKKVKKAFIYPAMVFSIACLVSLALLVFVVPQFEFLFKSFGADLPFLTQIIIQCSTFFKNYGLILAIFFVILNYSVLLAKKKSSGFICFIETMVLKIPILGPLFRGAIITRFSRTLAITFGAGIPLVNALTTVAGVTGSNAYTKAIYTLGEEIAAGQSMQIALKNTKLFPDLVIQMITIGEESGMLENMLFKIADFYEEEMNHTINILTDLLEPVIMVIVGILVGILIIAMYLPLFKLGSVV